MGWLPKVLAVVLSLPLLILCALAFFVSLPRFGALPKGERLERLQASPHYWGGYVHNIASPCSQPVPPVVMSWAEGQQRKSFVSILRDALLGTGKAGEIPAAPLPVVQTDLRALPRERDCIVWFGHSSYLLQLGGKRILVDPVFGTASPIPGINRAFPGTEVYSAADLPEVDVLLITHDHYDHLDCDTVQAIEARVGQVICPLGVGAHFEHWGYAPEKIRELDWGEHAELPGLRINAHTAYHYSGRNFNTRRRVLWASYVVEGNGRRLYLGGDSGYASHFAAIGRQYGGFDYAVVENGQYNTAWHQNHTLPHELPCVLRDLGARRALTVHHSKYKLSPHPWAEPLETALQLRERGFEVDIPMIGEPVYLDAPVSAPAYWWRQE